MSKPSKPVPEQLLTIADAAELLRVSEKTIRRWIKARELTAAQLGNQWRIRPRDLDFFVRERLEL